MLELATELEPVAGPEGLLAPGRAWVNPAWRRAERVAAVLRRQGFISRVHFLARFLQRVQALGIRFDPATFGQRFERARHYRQARPGYTTRVAVVDGLPIVYRRGGPRGRHVVLVSLLPADRPPPALVPAPAPGRLPAREAELGLAFDDPGVRAVCERARTLREAVELARRPPLQANRHVLRRLRGQALNWLAATARRWAQPSWPGRPGLLARASTGDIDRLVTCLLSLQLALQSTPLVDVTRFRAAAVTELRRRGPTGTELLTERMIELIREMENPNGPPQFTPQHAEALAMNARLASGKWVRPDGTIRWNSIKNQLSLTRWRFLPRAPEAASILRDGLTRLPNDGPVTNGVSFRARLLAALDTWVTGGTPSL